MNDDLVKALEANADHYVCIIMVNGRAYIRTSVEGFEEKLVFINEMADEMQKLSS